MTANMIKNHRKPFKIVVSWKKYLSMKMGYLKPLTMHERKTTCMATEILPRM